MKIKFLVPVVLLQTAMVMAWPFELPKDEDSLPGLVGAAQIQGGNTVVALAGAFEDPELLFLDSAGTLVRSITILERGGGSRALESGGILVPVEDGIAAAFHSEPRATGIDTDVAVVRVSGTGEIIWTYILGLDDQLNWMCTDMILCSDGGLLVTGCPGTMLPAGFVFKLSSSGELEWITAPDAIEGYCLSAVELPEGDFLCLVDQSYGEPFLQLLSEEGVIQSVFPIDTEGVSCGGIHLAGGSVWLTSSPGNSTLDAFRLDGEFGLESVVSVPLAEDVHIRSIEMYDDGFLLSGEKGTSGFLTLLDTDGAILGEEIFGQDGGMTIERAFRCDEGIFTMGTLCSGNGVPALIIDKF